MRWDETWHRLREWTNGQGSSERLAAQILLHDGYESLDPSHPLGGKDGGKDAVCLRDGKRQVMAVYFPRGRQTFGTIKKKLADDVLGSRANGGDALVFVTNQELTVSERAELITVATTNGVRLELYHLERITAILDTPSMASVRKQFLDIDFLPTQDHSPKPVEEPFGPNFEPNLFVLQKDELNPSHEHAAYEFCRVRIYSEALKLPSIEPEAEDAFLTAVREAFFEDRSSTLEGPTDERMLAEHRGDDLKFHRRWGWWRTGVLGMAFTLRDLYRAEVYSVADIAVDVSRFLTFANQIDVDRSARVLLGISSGRLKPEFDSSDKLARDRFSARLAGVESVSQPVVPRPFEAEAQVTVPINTLSADSHALTGALVVAIMRKLHHARIRIDPFTASIVTVTEATDKARTI